MFDTAQTDQTNVSWDELVGEGKKYRDNDAAAKAILEKDRFIAQLQNETAELRKTIPTADRSQEILDRLEILSKKPAAEIEPTRLEERVVEHTGITQEDVEKLLAEREARTRANQNKAQVQAELVKQFGGNYGEHVKEVARSLGVSTDYLEQMAGTTPQAFLKLVAPQKSDGGFIPPTGVRPDGGFQPTGSGALKQSHYEKLKQADRAKYFEPATQNKMMKDAIALGEAFFD